MDFEGSFATLSGVKMEPKPVQKPHPPLWFGARAPDALRRTARLADGWMGAGSSTNEAFIREHGRAHAHAGRKRAETPQPSA